MMIEKITALFEKAGKQKIEFKPAIRIKLTPHSPVVWIDQMFKVKDSYMITVSTMNDSINKNLNSLEDACLSSLSIRLYGLYGKDKVFT